MERKIHPLQKYAHITRTYMDAMKCTYMYALTARARWYSTSKRTQQGAWKQVSRFPHVSEVREVQEGIALQPQEVQIPMPAFLRRVTKTGSPPPARPTRWLIQQTKEREVYGREKAGLSGMQLMREVI